jgi:hypothetical protein
MPLLPTPLVLLLLLLRPQTVTAALVAPARLLAALVPTPPLMPMRHAAVAAAP